MLKPKARETQFEKVKIGEFITGKIFDVQYEPEHKFIFNGQESVKEGVRLVFELDGYQFKHYSRWMTFNYGIKSTLYQKYLSKLVENAEPDMDFDLDTLKGFPIKTIWSENKDFQNLESIFPLFNKLRYSAPTPVAEAPSEETLAGLLDSNEETPEEI